MTRIVAVAIRVGDIIASARGPARHGHVLAALYNMDNQVRVEPEDQGFLDTEGRFVNRHEAKIIAREAGQLLPRSSPLPELFSEDLW